MSDLNVPASIDNFLCQVSALTATAAQISGELRDPWIGKTLSQIASLLQAVIGQLASPSAASSSLTPVGTPSEETSGETAMESSDALCTVQPEVTSGDLSIINDAPSSSIDGARSLKRSLRSPSPVDGDRDTAITPENEDLINGARSLKRSLRSPSPVDGDRDTAITPENEDVSFTVVSNRKRKNKKKRRNTLLTSSSEAPASPPSPMDVVVDPPVPSQANTKAPQAKSQAPKAHTRAPKAKPYSQLNPVKPDTISTVTLRDKERYSRIETLLPAKGIYVLKAQNRTGAPSAARVIPDAIREQTAGEFQAELSAARTGLERMCVLEKFHVFLHIFPQYIPQC
ncbi:hypothetical protein ACJJTC_010397 [Scirpophaga incertulas]